MNSYLNSKVQMNVVGWCLFSYGKSFIPSLFLSSNNGIFSCYEKLGRDTHGIWKGEGKRKHICQNQ